MIQVITGDAGIFGNFKEINGYTLSEFKKQQVFDGFELNILDLSFEDLWKYNDCVIEDINMIKDLSHYYKMIEDNVNTKILIILPQNIMFKYNFYSSRGYIKSEDLKNLTDFISQKIYENVYNYDFTLNFGENSIKLKELNIIADFYFNETGIKEEQKILKSDKSNKLTTIKVDENIYFTTLDLMKSKEILEAFLEKTKIIDASNEEEEPEWFNDIKILDDVDIEKQVN